MGPSVGVLSGRYPATYLFVLTRALLMPLLFQRPSMEVANDLRFFELHHTVQLNAFYSATTARRQARQLAILRAEGAAHRAEMARARSDHQAQLDTLNAALQALTAVARLGEQRTAAAGGDVIPHSSSTVEEL